MISALLLLGFLPLAWLFLRGAKTSPCTRLRVTASSPWMLDHFCVSLGSVLREWPELTEVRVSLAVLETLDDASIASLKAAIRLASTARVQFCLDDYSRDMARLATANGIDAEHLGAPRASSTHPRQLLH